jgi:hypothetical protein
MAALQAQGSDETSDGSCADGAISLEEILSSTVSVENVARPDGQNAANDNFSVADFSACPTKDDGYVGQDGTMNWSDLANGESTNWPLRAYSNQNPINGTLSADEFFDAGNGTSENAYSGQQHICQSDYQNLDLQTDGFVAQHQVDDGMAFYDAPPNWLDGNDDIYLSDLLNEPLESQSLFEGDDMMQYFADVPEADFKYDMLGSVEGSDYQLPEMSNVAQKVCHSNCTLHFLCVSVYPLWCYFSCRLTSLHLMGSPRLQLQMATMGHLRLVPMRICTQMMQYQVPLLYFV